MNNQDKATPRPWAYEHEIDTSAYRIAQSPLYQGCIVGGDAVIADVRLSDFRDSRTPEVAQANMERIVHAVNAHDAHQELVALCTGILGCLEQGDLWKKIARDHAAGLLRKALEKVAKSCT